MISIDERRARDVLALPAQLLRRELRRNRAARRLHSDGSPDPATEGLRDAAAKTLSELDDNPDAVRTDPQRTRCRLIRTTALLVTDRLVPNPNGISEEIVSNPERYSKIHLSDPRHPMESVEVCLRAVPERETLYDWDGRRATYPEWHYDRETLLLMQELEHEDPVLRLLPDPMTVFLCGIARKMLADMHSVPAAYRMQPRRTRLRLLNLAVLIATDRMLSRDPGLQYQHGRQPARHVRIRGRSDGNSPECFQMRLLHLTAPE